jgi:hypothetical protein
MWRSGQRCNASGVRFPNFGETERTDRHGMAWTVMTAQFPTAPKVIDNTQLMHGVSEAVDVQVIIGWCRALG